MKGLSQKELDQKISESDEKINNERIKKLTIFEIAEIAGLDSWYKSLYSLMSDTLHASPRALEAHMVINKDRTNVLSLINEPDFTEHHALIYTIASSLIISIKSTGDIFAIDVGEFVENKTELINRLWKEI